MTDPRKKSRRILPAHTPRDLKVTARCLLASVVIIWVAGGCATTRVEPPAYSPVVMHSPDGLVRVTVWGNLTQAAHEPNRQSWWDRLIFGEVTPRRWLLRNPQGIAVQDENLYVCDQGWPAVMHMDLATGRMRAVLTARDGLNCPVDVALDSAQRIFVADTTRSAVLIFDPAGKPLGRLMPPKVEPESFTPTGVLVHEDVLFISDRAGRMIRRYDLIADEWLAPLSSDAGSTARLAVRQPLAPAGIGASRDGTVLVSDAMGGTVLRWTPTGERLNDVGARGRRAGELIRPVQACGTPSGLLIVADAALQMVVVFHGDESYAMHLPTDGNGWNGLTMPGGVACPSNVPEVIRRRFLDRADADALADLNDADVEWVIVSDTLGPDGLILLSVRREGERP